MEKVSFIDICFAVFLIPEICVTPLLFPSCELLAEIRVENPFPKFNFFGSLNISLWLQSQISGEKKRVEQGGRTLRGKWGTCAFSIRTAHPAIMALSASASHRGHYSRFGFIIGHLQGLYGGTSDRGSVWASELCYWPSLFCVSSTQSRKHFLSGFLGFNWI